MLLIRPDVEQGLRDNIEMMKAMPTEGMSPERAQALKEKIGKMESALDKLKQSEEFKRMSKEYWSNNDIQLSTMADIYQYTALDLFSAEQSIGKARKLKKRSLGSRLEKRGKTDRESMMKIMEFVPAGSRTGGMVRDVCEAWAKAKGMRRRIEGLKDGLEQSDVEMLAISKKISAERKKLQRLEKSKAQGAGTQRRKLAELEAKEAGMKRNRKARDEMISGLEKEVSELELRFHLNIEKLSKISRQSVMSEGAGRPLKQILIEYSLPQLRSDIGNLALRMPREILSSRQDRTIENYGKLRAELEAELVKARDRSRGKKVRDAIDSVMSAAVDQGAEDVKACVDFLEQGDIMNSKTFLERAFDSGNMHQYARQELGGMMDELMSVYDGKGELLKLEEDVRRAGMEMFNARLDLMRLDYITSGVHSPEIVFEAALMNMGWMISVGVLFEKESVGSFENIKPGVEFLKISNANGFSKEQAEGIDRLMAMLSYEAELVGQVENQAGIKGAEYRIASIVTARSMFENQLYLKSLDAGNEHAEAIRNWVLEKAGGYREVMEMYLQTAMNRELLGELREDLKQTTERIGRISGLCTEIGKLKASAEKAKGEEAVNCKITLGRRIKELEALLEGIAGEELDGALVDKISDPKIGGRKLYNEVTKYPRVAVEIRKLMSDQERVIRELVGEKDESTPIGRKAG